MTYFYISFWQLPNCVVFPTLHSMSILYLHPSEKRRTILHLWNNAPAESEHTSVARVSESHHLFYTTNLVSLRSCQYLSWTVHRSWFNHIFSPIPLTLEWTDTEIYYCIRVTLIAVCLSLCAPGSPGPLWKCRFWSGILCTVFSLFLKLSGGQVLLATFACQGYLLQKSVELFAVLVSFLSLSYFFL